MSSELSAHSGLQRLQPLPAITTAWYAVTLFVLVVLVAFIDRQIIILVLQDIRADFKLTDTHIGALQGGAMALFFAVAAIPLGKMVDSRNRRNLLLICMIVWGAFTALSGLAQSYWQLFICRVGVGVGEAALYPAVTSLIADFFEPRRRVFANMVFYVGTLIGASVGLTLGGLAIGWVGAHAAELPSALADLAPWRVAFIAVALPTPLVAALLLTIPEPAREITRQASGNQAVKGLVAYLRDNAAVMSALSIAVACASSGMNNTIAWMPTILIRVFGYSAADTGTHVGVILGAASVCGIGLAGLLMRRHRHAEPNLPMLRLVRVGLGACIALMLVMPWMRLATQMLTVFGSALFGYFIAAGMFTTLTQNLVVGEFRGRAIAIIYLIAAVVQTIIAMSVGVISDHLLRGERGLINATMIVGLLSMATSLFFFNRLYRRVARMASGHFTS